VSERELSDLRANEARSPSLTAEISSTLIEITTSLIYAAINKVVLIYETSS
jgi:hypothetical protein